MLLKWENKKEISPYDESCRGIFLSMKHEILSNRQLSPNVYELKVKAERIANIRQAGQFIILRIKEGGERIPLTLAGSDKTLGTITIIVQAVGKTTSELVNLKAGDAILDISGPLGTPTEIAESGKAICVGGGVGTAVIYPIAAALKENGVSCTSIIGGRSREWVILEDELSACGECVVCTDDGSYGRKGFVTDALRDELERGGVDIVYAVGPVPMMRAVANLTRGLKVHTIVSLNPLMIDGSGMCGGCRVTVDGKTKFACVDGPEFDAHKVDFDELWSRLGTYRAEEDTAKTHKCKL